jgi:hypothetical protein
VTDFAPCGLGQILPAVILEFLGTANSTIDDFNPE